MLPLFLSRCGGGLTANDLRAFGGDATAVLRNQALKTREAMQLRSVLNEIKVQLGIFAGYNTSQMGAGTGIQKATQISQSINSVVQLLVGASVADNDIFSYINNTITRYYKNIFACHVYQYRRDMVTSALAPAVATKLINIQAKYVSVLVQYVIQSIALLEPDQVKTMMAAAKQALTQIKSVV
jgi:hypothetical protein